MYHIIETTRQCQHVRWHNWHSDSSVAIMLTCFGQVHVDLKSFLPVDRMFVGRTIISNFFPCFVCVCQDIFVVRRLTPLQQWSQEPLTLKLSLNFLSTMLAFQSAKLRCAHYSENNCGVQNFLHYSAMYAKCDKECLSGTLPSCSQWIPTSSCLSPSRSVRTTYASVAHQSRLWDTPNDFQEKRKPHNFSASLMTDILLGNYSTD
jgi:hypothetical protein